MASTPEREGSASDQTGKSDDAKVAWQPQSASPTPPRRCNGNVKIVAAFVAGLIFAMVAVGLLLLAVKEPK